MLGGGQLSTEEGDGGGAVRCDLLEGRADGMVAGVRQELELGVLCREGQQDCFADGPLRILEGFLEI